MKKARFKYTILLPFLWLMMSCKKDAFNTEELFVYAPSGLVSADTWAQDYVIGRTDIFPVSRPGFPVLLTRSFKSDVAVTARIDTSLIARYDSIYKVTSPRLPLGTFTLSGTGTVTIKAGQTASSDSIIVKIADQTKIDPNQIYIIPVVLNTPGDDVPLSSKRQTMFVRVAFKSIRARLSGFSSGNTIPLTLNRTPAGDIFSPVQAGFTATLNTKFFTALKVSVAADNSLIAAYNTANGVNCVPFPASGFELEQQTATIPANELTASDTFKVKPLNPSVFEPGQTYLLPLRIKDEGPVAPDENNQVIYVSLIVKVQNIDPDNNTVSGSKINSTEWQATVSSTDDEYSQASSSFVFDGDYSTGWQSNLNSDNQPTFTLDMQDTHLVKGFSFTPMYWSFYGNPYISAPTAITVYSSTDGATWKAQGSYSGSEPQGSSTSPDFRFIKFYRSVEGRYFRFVITRYTGYAGGWGELQAFE